MRLFSVYLGTSLKLGVYFLCRTYKQPVIVSHCMLCFHICDQLIIDACLIRMRKKDWDDQEKCFDTEFLKLEEELWSKMHLEQASAVEAEEDNAEETLESRDGNLPLNDMGEAYALSAFLMIVVMTM